MPKKHDSTMLAAWAREHGITGYEHYDPKEREKRRLEAIRQSQNRHRRKEHDSFKRKKYK